MISNILKGLLKSPTSETAESTDDPASSTSPSSKPGDGVQSIDSQSMFGNPYSHLPGGVPGAPIGGQSDATRSVSPAPSQTAVEPAAPRRRGLLGLFRRKAAARQRSNPTGRTTTNGILNREGANRRPQANQHMYPGGQPHTGLGGAWGQHMRGGAPGHPAQRPIQMPNQFMGIERFGRPPMNRPMTGPIHRQMHGPARPGLPYQQVPMHPGSLGQRPMMMTPPPQPTHPYHPNTNGGHMQRHW
ncbi:hypothetical protein [Alicyclobacillus dauci]|uniref:Uncharacterized protein n=1 Tax=Alicyclobacillus dauci TaxID=1475485 RepID=A0ABY6Z0M0_9BACL|nr:hypothetical protein [Alicyclobacillus dauci]WAH36405.1 hypothetical protein NZD86_19625 [Alicyclobacillus dauci]